MNQVAQKVLDLVNGGMSLEEALNKALNEEIATRPRAEDRPEWIKTLSTIREVRDAMHVAAASLSKARKAGSEPAIRRYQETIENGKKRMEEFRLEIEKAEDPVKKAIELGEEPNGVLQLWIAQKEKELEVEVLRKKGNRSNKVIKAFINELDPSTPPQIIQELKQLGEEYLAQYEIRVKHGDIRILTLNRRCKFVNQ